MMSRNEKLVLEVSTGPIDDGSEIEGTNNRKADASVAVGGGGGGGGATKSGSRSGGDSGRGASSTAQSGGGGGGGANTTSDGKTKRNNSAVTTGKSSESVPASLPTGIRNNTPETQCPPSQQQDQELINSTDGVCGEHPPLLVDPNTNDHVLVTFTSGKEEWVHKSKLRSAASRSQPPPPAEESTNGNAKDEEELALFKMIEEQATAPSPAEESTDGNAEEKEEDDSSSSSSSSSSSCSSSSSSSSSDGSANDMGGNKKKPSSTASTSAQQSRPPPVITTCSSTSTTTKPTRVDTSAQTATVASRKRSQSTTSAGSSASAFNRGRGIGAESAPPSTARLFPDPSDLVKALTRWMPPRAAIGKKGIEFYDPIRCKYSQRRSRKDNPFLQYENEKKSDRTALTFRDSDEVMSTFVPCLLDEGLCKL